MQHALGSKIDIRVHVGNWKPANSQAFPPIKAVLKTPFWSHERYQDVRDRLRKPAPEFKVLPGGDYGSCQLVGAGEKLSDEDTIEEDLGGGRTVEHMPAVCGLPFGWDCDMVLWGDPI